MSTRKESSKSKGGKSRQRRRLAEYTYVETLAELEAYTDAIIDALNNDKRLALLAAADPIGVLRDLGYDLSEDAARQLERGLPRMSREGRDRYIAWMRAMDTIPESLDIKLRRRPSGTQLLDRSLENQSGPAQEKGPKNNPGPKAGKGTAGFDAIMQFGESFCEKMMRRHYADGRLPRSVYEVGGKLHFFRHTGDYEDYRESLGDADREIHFFKPDLDFVSGEAKRVRVRSLFVAIGFGAKPVKGTATVFGTLSLAKDAYGHPSFIDVVFDGLTATDTNVQVTDQTLSSANAAQLSGMVHTAWRDFRKLAVGWGITSLKLPVSFPLVDGAALSQHGVKAKPGEVTFTIKKPTGGSVPLLQVGFNRAERKGSGKIDTVPDHMKTGGQYAVLQDAAWLEEGLNASFIKGLPVRFDPDSGKKDKNGDFRLDSIVWTYRKGGLTGKMNAVYEDYSLDFINADVSGEVYIDIQFHSSEPTLKRSVDMDWDEPSTCVGVVITSLLGMAAGGLVGGLLGFGVGILVGAPAIGALIGATAGAMGGFLTAAYLWGTFPASFDTGGLLADKKQTIKLTHQQRLPDVLETVQVVPNDLKVSDLGTLMSAKLVGPVAVEAEPYLAVAGSFSGKFEKSLPGLPPSPEASGGDNATGPGTVALGGILTPSRQTLTPYVIGNLSLAYRIDKTWGLQGPLEYSWTFNSSPIGSGASVKVDIPLTADLVGPAGIRLDKVTTLGIVKVAVEDAFGRKATWKATVSFGSEKNFRPLRDPGLDIPDLLDPLGRLKQLEEEGPVAPPGGLVGWVLNGGDTVMPQGMLVNQTTISSPQLTDNVLVVCTTPEVMRTR